MRGRFIASAGAWCTEGDHKIRAGGDVYYDGHDDEKAACFEHVTFDLFGDVA